MIDEAGLTVPDFETLRKTTLDALLSVDMLGGDYLMHPDDDATQVIEVILLQLASGYQCIEALSQQDTDQQQGVLLRELGSVVGAEYPSRARSTIEGKLLGDPGALIPAQTLFAYLPSGTPADQWRTVEDYTIGAGGTADAELESAEFGEYEAGIAAITSWARLTLPPGLDGFVSTGISVPGRLEPTDEEVREAIRRAGRANASATHDSDVENVSGVTGVSSLVLQENRTLAYDPVYDLPGKKARFIAEGGRKQKLLDAIVTSESTSLDTTDTGTVIGTSTRFDGKVITTSFSRPLDVPILFRVTISFAVPTSQEEAEVGVFAAVAERMEEQDTGEKVVPVQYGAAIVNGFAENLVESVLVEVRRTALDAWQVTPLSLSAALAERADVRTGPTPAEVTGTAEEELAILAGQTLEVEVDGGLVQLVTFVADHTLAATAVVEIEAQVTGLDALDADGRVRLRTESSGAASSIEITSGTAAAVLGFTVGILYEGTDGDVEVIVV